MASFSCSGSAGSVSVPDSADDPAARTGGVRGCEPFCNILPMGVVHARPLGGGCASNLGMDTGLSPSCFN
eukprot:9504102-Pyramimonas_sp.AAC.2